MVKETSELPENKLRPNFRLGDITWVKHTGSSWWPAQVIDEACVSSKPKKKAGHDALVRLYGTCQCLYVDPWKSNAEFEMMLKQENKSAMEAFHEELSRTDSPGDYDEETVKSKAKTSSTKDRKRKGSKRSDHRGVKELASTEGLGDEAEKQYDAEQDQVVGKNATTGATVRKGRKREGARQSSPIHDEELAIDKSSSEISAEGLKGKAEKQASTVRYKKSRKVTTARPSVVRGEGLRRSGRSTNAKEHSDAAEDSGSRLRDTSARENATEVGKRTSENQNQHQDDAVIDGTLAPDREIRSMVRDILFGDIIARQHAAEMAYVDEVIFGFCDATLEKTVADSATTVATNGGRGTKRTGSGLEEADSCNATQRPRKGKGDKATSSSNDSSSSPSRDVAMD